jgi:hypothetical protein
MTACDTQIASAIPVVESCATNVRANGSLHERLGCCSAHLSVVVPVYAATDSSILQLPHAYNALQITLRYSLKVTRIVRQTTYATGNIRVRPMAAADSSSNPALTGHKPVPASNSSWPKVAETVITKSLRGKWKPTDGYTDDSDETDASATEAAVTEAAVTGAAAIANASDSEQ